MHKILQIRLNLSVNETCSSFGVFDVKTELNGVSNWLSIPYELFITFIKTIDKNIETYINGLGCECDEEIISDLDSLDYDWDTYMCRYLNMYYGEDIYEMLPQYNPDKTFEDMLDEFEEQY